MTSEEVSKTARKPNAEHFIGIGNLPKQVRRKGVKRGFQFTLMVVGESGLGKSTLLNSLFLTDLYVANNYKGATKKFEKTMSINESTLDLNENGVRLHLTVIDTPGFGDNVDNSGTWNSIIQNVDRKFEGYLNSESRVNRTVAQDTRIHCCLYFIAPTGHGLKQLDIEFMRKLHHKMNIVPIIAKADTLTEEECVHFKAKIMNEINKHNINIYRFPPLGNVAIDKDLDQLRRLPFAVVGSNLILEVGGKKIKVRKYPWGIVEVENLEHCDFIALRNLLLRSHMQDMIDTTNDVHYENYRSEKLSTITGNKGVVTTVTRNSNPLDEIEKEREEREDKLKTMENEMVQVFSVKVNEKKKKLMDAEADFNKKYEETMFNLSQARKALEQRRKEFEIEREQYRDIIEMGTSDESRKEGKKEKKNKEKNK